MNDILIAAGFKPPVDRDANRALHQDLLDDLNKEITKRGWPAADFVRYSRSSDWVAIEIEPRDSGALTLDRLAEFREERRRERESQPEQGSLC